MFCHQTAFVELFCPIWVKGQIQTIISINNKTLILQETEF
ncbi:hypothetical protein THERMOT_1554 [Bathymodiolus thermophilus thioautotrophic gill symbiont]|nr:hypothetical protein THERMOT_1554 [Bathymodiolus thermophilus thioautotrophic gill symbiont]